METKNIIQQGTCAKYAIAIEREGFDAATDDFAVRLSWGMMGRSMIISKQDMQPTGDDRYLFHFDTTSMTGAVTATTMLQVPDSDIPGGTMQEVDRRYIAFIITSPLPRTLSCPCSSDPDNGITFERIDAADQADHYRFLCDKEGRRLVTSDSMNIVVLNKHKQ